MVQRIQILVIMHVMPMYEFLDAFLLKAGIC